MKKGLRTGYGRSVRDAVSQSWKVINQMSSAAALVAEKRIEPLGHSRYISL